MRLVNYFLIALSFMNTVSILGMDSKNRIVETSHNFDSNAESEQEELALLINQAGNYIIYFNVQAINKSHDDATVLIGIKINDKNSAQLKKYLIKSNSTTRINGHFTVHVKENDWVELQFNTPLTVEMNSEEVDLIDLALIEPKTKL